MYQIDIKFDRQLRPATEISWVVSYGGKAIPRWRTAAILKIVISPYLSEIIIRFRWNFVHSSRFWTGWRSRDQKWKSYRLRVRQNVFLVTQIHRVSKNAPTLTSCSFNKHGLILIIFSQQHQHTFRNVPCGWLSWLPVSFLLHVKYTLSNISLIVNNMHVQLSLSLHS